MSGSFGQHLPQHQPQPYASAYPLPPLQRTLSGQGSTYPPPTSATAPMSTSSSRKGNSKAKRSSFSEQNDMHGDGGAKIRAYAACKNCRLKKVKCLPGPTHAGSMSGPDASPPGPCQQCLQAGTECIYAPTRDRAAYSRQYVANLETRVQALENFQTRMLPLIQAYEQQHGHLPLPPVSTISERREERAQENNSRLDKEGKLRSMDIAEVPLESSESGEGDEDHAIQGSDAEDVGQMTQDERGNYRWIGSSNTLSLLDSFSHRDEEHHNDGSYLPHLVALQRTHSLTHPSSHANSAGHSPNTAAGSDNTPRNPYFGEVAGAGVVKALPPIEDVQHPSKDKATEMIDAFFREVHPSLPVLLEYEFREQYKELNAARDRGEPWSGKGGFIAVVFAVFALGERVLVTTEAWRRERNKLDQNNGNIDTETVLPGEAEAGVVWYERAQILHYTTSTDINISQVQALTLMAAFQASVNAVPMSWLQAGKALRVALDLGLHRSTARLNIPYAEKQLRARCWWALYGLERLMSISLGRPLGVDDLDIDVAYPAEIDDEGLKLLSMKDPKATPGPEAAEEPMASTMSGFIALTKLCKIAGRVAHLLYRPSNGRSVNDPSWAVSQQNAINKLDKHLRDWLANEVPSKYKDPSSTHSVSLFSAILSNSYFAVLITLHRNFLPSNPDYPRPKPPPSSQSLAHCVDAARSVVHIASQSRVLIPPTHHLAMYCQYLWSSAIILLLCEVQARDQVINEAVGAQVESCRQCLQALEPVWPGSRKLKELVNDVAARAKDVQVESVVAVRPGKKRKSSATPVQAHGQMPPPMYGSPRLRSGVSPQGGSGSGSWQMTPSSSAGGSTDLNKRQRLYETSDTRTIVREDDPQQSQKQNQLSQYPTQPFYPSTLNYPLAPYQGQGETNVYPLDMSFDLGGVTFDGLDMLQGFGDSASNFWNSLGFMGDTVTGSSGPGNHLNNINVNPYTVAATTSHNGSNQAQGQMFSGQNTPSSAGANPSPTWHLPAPASAPMQYPVSHGNGNGSAATSKSQTPGMENTFVEFWDQIAGNSFDWQADPNVPFNI